MKFFGKLLLYTFISLVLGIVSLFIIKKILLNEVYISRTNTNLIETIDKNLFKTHQMSIDVFINYNNRYVGVIPYVVQAGFDLDKAKVEKLQDGSFLVKLPAPEITNISQGEGVWIKNSSDTSFLKQFMSYGELQVKYVALERGILEKANKHAKEFLPELFASLGIKVKVETTEPKKVRYSVISSKRCGVSFRIPEEVAKNFEVTNNDNEPNPFCLVLRSKDRRVIGGLMFLPLGYYNYKTYYKQFSTYNPNLKYFAKFSSLYPTFLYEVASKDLILIWMPAEDTYNSYSSDIEEKFPLIAFISSTLKDNHYTVEEVHDCFGITKIQWEQASIKDKRNLISAYFWFLPNRYRFDSQTMLLTTKENYRDMPEGIREFLDSLKEKLYEEDFNWVLFEVYERPRKFIFAHHESFWIFGNDGYVRYVEDVDDSNSKPVVIPYTDFSRGYWKDGCFCLKEGLCFSKEISPIIKRLMKYGFLKFYGLRQ